MTTLLAPHLTAYLRERLPRERQASRNTVEAYTYTFKLLFAFATKRLGVAPSALTLEQLDAPFLLEFLAHLQTERGNSARTRNARLVALKSFMHFIEYRVPSAVEQVRRVLAIPMQRLDTMLVRHVDGAEAKAILDAPDPTTRLGIRDRALLLMGLAGGLRVSEIVGLRLDELSFDGAYLELRVRGKGRKQRGLVLWKEVADAVRAWLAVRGEAPVPEVFLNARGQPISRWGCAHVLDKHVKAATAACPSIAKRRVSPHVLRHTCAMSILQATGDIRKVALWLGHASQQTTEVYLQADPTEKLAALDAVKLPSLRRGTFSPPDALLAMLAGEADTPVVQASPSRRKRPATSRSPAPTK
jgi:site-specific recombinase XerD